mgnify:FL=1
MVNKGPEQEQQSLPDDLLEVDTYVQEEPEGTLTRDVAAGVGNEDARRNDGGNQEGTVAADRNANVDTAQAGPEQALYETPGFKEYQSKTDQRIAQLQSQVEQANQAQQMQRRQAEVEQLENTVQAWKHQQYQALIDRGVEDATAQEIANAYGDLAKQSYLANKGATSAEAQTSTAQGQVAEQVKKARAYELSAQYQVPFNELAGINDPNYMETHAKNLARMAKLEGQLSGQTSGQVFDTSQPATDVAPSDAERILDAYAAGDSRVTRDMAAAASKQLGMSIF